MSDYEDVAGLDAVRNAILKLYPEQEDHIQHTALVKFW